MNIRLNKGEKNGQTGQGKENDKGAIKNGIPASLILMINVNRQTVCLPNIVD